MRSAAGLFIPGTSDGATVEAVGCVGMEMSGRICWESKRFRFWATVVSESGHSPQINTFICA
jgi:hypothetical protein